LHQRHTSQQQQDQGGNKEKKKRIKSPPRYPICGAIDCKVIAAHHITG
jgi:hypothetical protein